MVEQRNFAGNIAYDDLREWLAMAGQLGEVRTVKGANCEEDIGLAAEAVLRAEHGPCVVFEDILGLSEGSSSPAQHVCRQAAQHDARLIITARRFSGDVFGGSCRSARAHSAGACQRKSNFT